MCFVINTYGQDSTSYAKEQRKGKLFFSVGTDYRITPIYKINAGIRTVREAAINPGRQVDGFAFNYNLDHFITKNLAVGFSNSFRYDMVAKNFNIASETGFTSVEKSLIIGFHFYFDYHFKIFKNSEIFARVGLSFLNRNTNLTIKETFEGNEGVPDLAIFSEYDTAYEPWNFAIGYKKNRFSLIGGIYSSANSEYTRGTSFIIPYFGLRYNIGNLLKK